MKRSSAVLWPSSHPSGKLCEWRGSFNVLPAGREPRFRPGLEQQRGESTKNSYCSQQGSSYPPQPNGPSEVGIAKGAREICKLSWSLRVSFLFRITGSGENFLCAPHARGLLEKLAISDLFHTKFFPLALTDVVQTSLQHLCRPLALGPPVTDPSASPATQSYRTSSNTEHGYSS